ncbi:MAG: PIN domain-containing protein [Candidatus Lokiarchaeia archaeon]
MKITIDTNIFINVKEEEEPFFKYSSKILDAIEDGQLKGVISIITIAELCVGYYNVNKPKEKDEYISKLYSQDNFIIVNLDRVVADQSAKIRSKTNLRLPDSIIVAVSLLEKVSFLISNDERFNQAEKLIKVCTSEEFCENYLSSK